MRILITNDDGIYSRGLWALAEALSGVAEVTVVAPDREQSGVSAAITLHNPVRVTEVVSQYNHIKTYAVEGTPADSVILGLDHIIKGPVDLVLSGINEGANLGSDVFLSGTVGAALQGYFRGISAMAVSVTSLKDVHYEVAARLVRLLCLRLLEQEVPRPVLLNVNLPNQPLEKIEGLLITRMASRTYIDSIEEGNDGKRAYFWIRRKKQSDDVPEEGTDRWAVRRNLISITPLHVDWTHTQLGPQLSPLATSLFRQLRDSG